MYATGTHLLYMRTSGFQSRCGGILKSRTLPYLDGSHIMLTSFHSCEGNVDFALQPRHFRFPQKVYGIYIYGRRLKRQVRTRVNSPLRGEIYGDGLYTVHRLTNKRSR